MIAAALLLAILLLLTTAPTPVKVREARAEAVFINLDRRPDRRKDFEKVWAVSDVSATVPLSRFEAVDSSLPENRRKGLITPQGQKDITDAVQTGRRTSHFQLTPGAVGVYQSHMRIWERYAKRDDLDELWVFEDDASIPSDLMAQLNAFGPPPDDFDVLLLGWNCTKCGPGPFQRAHQFHLLHAMVVSRKGLRKLAGMPLLPMNQQLDAALSELTDDLVVYTAGERPLVHQNEVFETDIQMLLTMTTSARTRREHEAEGAAVVVREPVLPPWSRRASFP